VCLLLEAYVKIGLLAKGGKQEPNGKEHNAVHGMVWLATQVVSSMSNQEGEAASHYAKHEGGQQTRIVATESRQGRCPPKVIRYSNSGKTMTSNLSSSRGDGWLPECGPS